MNRSAKIPKPLKNAPATQKYSRKSILKWSIDILLSGYKLFNMIYIRFLDTCYNNDVKQYTPIPAFYIETQNIRI